MSHVFGIRMGALCQLARRSWWTLPAWGIALGGCSGTLTDPDGLPKEGPLVVAIQTDRTTYTADGAAFVTMVNRTSETLMIDVCGDVLERRDGATWKAIVITVPGEACPAIGITLSPNAPFTFPFSLRTATTPGVYRLRRGFWPAYGGVTDVSYRRSNMFRVQ